MEITVVVTKILQSEQFAKRDGTYGMRHSFVGKTNKGQYDKEMKFDVVNEETWVQMAIAVGKTYEVSFDASSRSWNSPTKGEMWFTSLTAWRAVLQATQYRQPQAQPQPQQEKEQQRPSSALNPDDKIPF